MSNHQHSVNLDNSEDQSSIDPDLRYQEIKKITIAGAVVNSVLAIGKVFLGIVGQSQALVADGVHSLADLVSDIIVLVAAREASKEADEEHPYGHGRIETVVEVLLGGMLVLVAAGIMFDAAARIIEPERLLSPTWYALVAAAVSIFANEGLYQYTILVAKKIRSNMLKANAWHHRTDAISSVIALVGIAGSMMGFAILDAIAAIGVSLLITKVGWDIGQRSLRELIDTALEPEKVDQIRNVIMAVDGVKAVHSLRTRSMGGYALVDVHILVLNSRISVSEGHQISERVMRHLKRDIDEVSDVTVHIDPEDDEAERPSSHLPLRRKVEKKLDSLFQGNPYYIQRKGIVLHYLAGQVAVDIELPLSVLQTANAEEIKKSFSLEKGSREYIGDINLAFS